MSYKITIEQLHLYNKKHVLIHDAMHIAEQADTEIAKLKARNYHLESTRLKDSNRIKSDAIEEMIKELSILTRTNWNGHQEIRVTWIEEYT